MRDSRLEQSQMYYKNVLAKKITEDVNFVPAYEEAMEKIEAKIPHVIQLISHDHRAFKIVQDCALDLASAFSPKNPMRPGRFWEWLGFGTSPGRSAPKRSDRKQIMDLKLNLSIHF
ncbi:MAG: hypothetical protein CM15mP45_12640 [Deltaproteobacteria bacterium]|nr:MAG: hypothetical protein CM15mP45_12640 [Deltaproteobacteria bacterium]